jgi:hypothetical protein
MGCKKIPSNLASENYLTASMENYGKIKKEGLD